MSVATKADGTLASRQEFDPWGSVHSGNVAETTLDYTGQWRDDTGLLFYNARYYDPAIGRFISADTIVPGSGPLTVSPSDATASEMWRKSGGGTGNPQELNRYSYVNNNPIKNTDPTGHCIGPVIIFCIAAAASAATEAATIVGAIVVGGFVIAGSWIAGDELRKAHAATVNPGKPLTSDEEKLIKRIGSVPKWLEQHPDLEEEAKAVQNGETLQEGMDHVGEAEQQVSMLDKAIKHLEKVQKSRDSEGQDAINQALEQARRFRQQLKDILYPK